MKPKRIYNHHMKKSATKERVFYTRTDLVNFGVTKEAADRMIAEGRH